MAKVRFTAPTLYGGVSYAKNQVVDLSDEDIRALGDSVERTDDVDVEETVEERLSSETDPNVRQELDVKSELGDAQDVPDALRDEQENDRQREQTAIQEQNAKDQQAPQNKQVKQAPKKK